MGGVVTGITAREVPLVADLAFAAMPNGLVIVADGKAFDLNYVNSITN
jgi:hypothetical protein